VLLAIIVGALIGHFQPEFAVKLKPLGDGFIRLIKMLVTPIVFCTVVLGIAAMPDLRKVGRVGIKALVYFEVLTTIALIIGLVVVNTLQPGAGFHVDPTTLDAKAVASYAGQAHAQSFVDFLLGIIPTTLTSAFVSGELLQVLLVSVLFGVALAMIGARARAMVEVLESASAALFRIVAMVMWLAPLGAMGAMAFTIGRYGLGSLGPLASLMGSFYLTCLLFVVIVLGAVCRLAGFSLFRLLGYINEEMLTVVGTSSSESVLAPLMEKLERLGCRRTTVGLVVPTGYSFNLDGTSIYLTMAAVFLAQALDIDLTLGQELTIILVAMLTSKGAAAVTGGGFITLAATLAVIPTMPVAALALILGVDRFMSEARALTNLIGNAVATVVVSRWEQEVSAEQVQAALARG
jgi:aerobic C4-dicarboxylate transport protein